MERSPMFLGRWDKHCKNGNFTKSNLQIQCSPHKNPSIVLNRLSKNNTQLNMEKQKKIRITKTVLYKKDTSRGITIPDFKIYYRAIVMRIAWYWYKKTDRWTNGIKIKEPDINSHTYEHLIFDKLKLYDGK